MSRENARLSILKVVADHPGEWGWYQFERTFPPGWFRDEPANITAKQILDRLVGESLIVVMPGEKSARYHLTIEGSAFLEKAVATTPA